MLETRGHALVFLEPQWRGMHAGARNVNTIKPQMLTDDTLTNEGPKVAQPNAINTIIGNTPEKALNETTPYNVYFRFEPDTEVVSNLVCPCQS